MDKQQTPTAPSYAPAPVIQVVHIPPLILGPSSSKVTCPSCQSEVRTEIEVENSTKTHLIAILLCVLCFPLACVPYCMDDCKSKNHYCPNCTAYLGRYQH